MEYVLMKLGKFMVSGEFKNIDFYKEHKKVIDQYGYVDFARFGRTKLFMDFDHMPSNVFFIKAINDSKIQIIKATFEKEKEGTEKHFPEYYKKLDLKHAEWARITNLEIVDRDYLLSNYTLRNGKPIKGLDRGLVTNFVIVDKQSESLSQE